MTIFLKNKKLYINTLGCQMNVYDSSQMAATLKKSGYKLCNSASSADLVLLNTCAIREKASQKAFSFLGRLSRLKDKNKKLIIGVCGCMAQQEGYEIIRRMPFVDFVAGTDVINRLAHIVSEIEKKKIRIVDIKQNEQGGKFEEIPCNFLHTGISEFVTIMRGCNNFCSYCVVPYVRGREISRKPENIIAEIKQLVANGAKEITLLGQNVNSYGKKEGMTDFPKLLAMVNNIKGLDRIRFTTSHPKDLGDDLIDSFKKLDKLCNHIHLPVQSGSDSVLKKMNRKYSIEDYIKKIEKLRFLNPDIAITSDFIVGFCNETKTDFEQTLDLVKKIRFDGIFAFVYSERPNTAALKLGDNVSEEEKKERLLNLLEFQEHYTIEKNRSFIGKKYEVLVEGPSKKKNFESGKKEWTGRTSFNKIVNFISDSDKEEKHEKIAGKLFDIKIEKAFSHSLWGKL